MKKTITQQLEEIQRKMRAERETIAKKGGAPQGRKTARELREQGVVDLPSQHEQDPDSKDWSGSD